MWLSAIAWAKRGGQRLAQDMMFDDAIGACAHHPSLVLMESSFRATTHFI